MSKQQLVQKILSAEDRDIKKRLDEIIDECKNHGVRRISYLYGLLKEFITLKQVSNPRYKWSDLKNEDLGLSEANIKYVKAYQYVSNGSKKMIEQGKITENKLCSYLHKFSFTRDPIYQQKICEKIISGEYSWAFMQKWSKDQAQAILNGEKPKVETKRLISFTTTINFFIAQIKRIEIRKDKELDDLIKATKNLLNYLEGIK